jgi:hypothetical protein
MSKFAVACLSLIGLILVGHGISAENSWAVFSGFLFSIPLYAAFLLTAVERLTIHER